MKPSLTLLPLLCVTSAQAFAQPIPACEQTPFPREQNAAVLWPEQLPARDYLDVIQDCLRAFSYTFGRPESPWLDSEQAAFKSALAKQQVDVLVAPFQVQGYGLDAPSAR